MEVWDIWYPGAGAQGLPLLRARIEPQRRVWVHAAPRAIQVEVRDDDGARRAFARRLERTSKGYLPMTLLEREGGTLIRRDGWPESADIGSVVLLAGGEAGVLTAWWNAQDGSEWRWSLEFYNRR